MNKELKKLLKEFKKYLAEIDKYEKLYKINGITEEEQAEIDDLKRKIQKVILKIEKKKQEIENGKIARSSNKDDVKNKLKNKLEAWLDDQLLVAANAIEKSPHKQFTSAVGDNLGTAITSNNKDGIFDEFTDFFKTTFEKKVDNKYKLEDVQTAWEESVKEVKASISTHIDKYVAFLLLGLEYNSIIKKRIRIAKKGEAALSQSDLKYVLEEAIDDEMDNGLPSIESLNTAFEKSFSTFFTPDANKKEVSLKSIKTKCRTIIVDLLDKLIAAIDGLEAEDYSSVNVEKLIDDLNNVFKDKVSDDFYFGRKIYQAFQKDLESNDPSTVYKHWTSTLDALKSDESFISDIARTVCTATGKVTSLEVLGEHINISQNTLDDIESNISELFSFLPTTSDTKTVFEQNSIKKEPIITPINPSPVDEDSITEDDIRVEFTRSLTIWCNGASGAINDVSIGLNSVTPSGKKAASWWQFGGNLVTSIGHPFLKITRKVALAVGNLIYSTIASAIGNVKDKNGKVNLGKVISSWRSSINQYSTDSKQQEKLFKIFLDGHKDKSNKELLKEAKLFKGILPSKADLKTAILGSLDFGAIGKITLEAHCFIQFGRVNPLKAMRNPDKANMYKIEAIAVNSNLLMKKTISEETSVVLMSIYSDQTNIFETGVEIEANITFTDFVRNKEVCKVRFAISNGNASIGKATQDEKTFTLKMNGEELKALWNKFIASARTDNAFSIAEITE